MIKSKPKKVLRRKNPRFIGSLPKPRVSRIYFNVSQDIIAINLK